MDRRAFSIKETRFGQRIARRAETAHDHATTRLTTEPIQHAFVRGFLNIDSTAHDNNIVAGEFIEVHLQLKFSSVRTGDHFAAITRESP